MATACIAATTGFSEFSTILITVCSEGSCKALGVLNSRISAPPEKAFPPPMMTIALIELSSCAC